MTGVGTFWRTVRHLKPALQRLLAGQWKKGSIPDKWDGQTGQRIAQQLEHLICV